MSLKRASVGTLRSKTVSSYRFSSNRLSLRRFPFPSAPPVAAVANYIEEVFSTYLYAGNSDTQTITNGIDLSGKGGLVWIKQRTSNATSASHQLTDTNRGVRATLFSNSTTASDTNATYRLTAFNSNGFSVNDMGAFGTNISGETYTSWTFRKQPKFFDVVTYTGNGSVQNIAHNLGSVPGCIIIKRINVSGYNWPVYHRSVGNAKFLSLNTVSAEDTNSGYWNSTTPTDSVFTVGANSFVNDNGGSFVAYLFAHDAGGFGLTGSDNVISCGNFTSSTSAGVSVTLGYEPQLIIAKLSSSAGPWFMIDNMRGMPVNAIDAVLQPNSSIAENSSDYNVFTPTATGFIATSSGSSSLWGDSQTVTYIAIRRGPMKTPTSGTSVFIPVARTGTSATATISAGFPPDMSIVTRRTSVNPFFNDKMRGASRYQGTVSGSGTSSEVSDTETVKSFDQNGITVGTNSSFNLNAATIINWLFRRAPGFFDIVAYTGTGVARSVTHNLGVAPELLIVKRRISDGSFTNDWVVWTKYATPQQNDYYTALNLNTPWRTLGDVYWGSSGSGTPNMTSTTFSLGTFADVNASAATYYAYLFASCPGVSKVGSYTGNGSSQTIDCGFTAGARFVMIKRLDVSSGWLIWDTARGIIADNDPYIDIRNSAAEVTTNDSVDTDNSGFIVNQLAATDINVIFSPYLFLAIA
jgi:hypothetical protein